MYGSSDSVNNKNAIDRFQKIIDWGVEQYKSGNFKDENGQDNAGTKLDAVFAFAIAYEFAIQNKRTEVYIPIKYLPSELRNNPNGDPQHLLTIFFYDVVNGGAFSNPFMMASEEQRRTAEQYVKNHSKILGISSVRAVGLTSTHLVLDFIKQK